ncbi:trk system potassium uptake protein TrkH [Mesoflavibacter sabulilitoris]|uniref:Potassium transporter TrkH n=1 Tax=Mesoflavibacter zeaxanthinifaciens subsp. sabulilitoris TaxID=1520893 RepID=A0A2T1NM65_9FLAO|nr:potassium transporter TrkG [Mesoflavibacter zeaxanthinifaciens]MBB3124630.1 trk system potassium uptake protein TrkH [Mesoflavibacter zeaxanthinifaciens subsp. sabulilitoris]PSG93995.1 potassium transporter TrkH [Mesoflavibacter zeaxanthinifaciens subsp. sabulilitoris]
MRSKLLKQAKNWYRKFQISKSPQMNLVWGFFLYTIIGFFLLSIPFFHKTDVSLLDNLFISTSAISTTGLVTISIFDSYNYLGQFVIMCLIQIGGIGYMTLTTYYLIFTTKRITRWHSKLIGAEFTLPNTIKIKDFIKSVIIFTLVMESIGAVLFYIAFTNSGMENIQAIWFSIFHSISSFCTAGFGLFNDGFEGFKDNVFINTIISCLAIAGSLGFIVITDLWYRMTGRSKEVSFTTKIIIYGFIVLLAIGTSIIYTTESATITGDDSPLMISFFQAMSAMTTVGFNTVPIGDFSLPILLLLTFLMYIGASPSGTAGGMKITTLTAMSAILKSRLLGQKKITFLNRLIPFERIYVATSTFMLYTSLIFLFSFLLSYTENFSFDKILFEAASALGTVGLSTGITGDLSSLGKILIIMIMFIGRVGVLTFGFALLKQKHNYLNKIKEDDLAV